MKSIIALIFSTTTFLVAGLPATIVKAELFDVETKLTASDAAAGDWFGNALATDGNMVLVAARQDDGGGAGLVYVMDVATRSELFKLTADDAEPDDKFGTSIAIHANRALVGTLDRGLNNSVGSKAGSAYLFDVEPSSATFGTQLFKLTPSDPGREDAFGEAVAISGNTALVGARFDNAPAFRSGSAYLFDVTDPSNPVELHKLIAPDAAVFNEFGLGVAIDGDMALVGARFSNDAGKDSGSAYLFDVTTGDLVQKLTASDAAANDEFALSVAFSGDTVLVGAFLDDDVHDHVGGINSGSIYLFESSIPEPSSFLLGSLAGLFGLCSCSRPKLF